MPSEHGPHRPGPQSGPRNGASRENANQKRQRFVFSRLVPFRSAADCVGRRSHAAVLRVPEQGCGRCVEPLCLCGKIFRGLVVS